MLEDYEHETKEFGFVSSEASPKSFGFWYGRRPFWGSEGPDLVQLDTRVFQAGQDQPGQLGEGPDFRGYTLGFYYDFTMKIQPREDEVLTRWIFIVFHSRAGLASRVRAWWP